MPKQPPKIPISRVTFQKAQKTSPKKIRIYGSQTGIFDKLNNSSQDVHLSNRKSQSLKKSNGKISGIVNYDSEESLQELYDNSSEERDGVAKIKRMPGETK